MKKIILTLLIGIALFSCSPKQDPKNPDEIQKEISKYKNEIKKLNEKVTVLEKQLDTMGKGTVVTNAVRVNVSTLKNQEFTHYFNATGTVEAVNEAYINPQINGQITKIYVKDGDKVKKDQLLAKLNTDVIENNIAELKVNLQLAETIYKKQKELWSKNIGSELQYLQAKNNYFSLKNKLKTLQSQYDLSFIKSPLTGEVDVVYQKVGEMGNPAMRFAHVINLDTLTVKAKISERYLPAIKLGDEVKVLFPTFPGMEILTNINRIGNVINVANRTFGIELGLTNKDKKIKPNMLATLVIKDYYSNNAIVVPSHLIREDLKGKYIYVSVTNGSKTIATKKYVKTGYSYQGNTEITSGLTNGDTIITDGYSNVSDGVVIATK